MRRRAAAAADVLLAHPRHLVLFAAVAGLLLGLSSRVAPLAVAALVAIAAPAAARLSDPADGIARTARLPPLGLGPVSYTHLTLPTTPYV